MGFKRPESNSCGDRAGLSQYNYYPPCWEQHNHSYTLYCKRGISQDVRCHRLYPVKAATWEAILEAGRLWDGPKWVGVREEIEAGTCRYCSYHSYCTVL
jgi:hypothetical protein